LLANIRGGFMELTREEITTIYKNFWECINSGNWNEWLDYFSESCTFTNSAMTEVIKGRDSLEELAKTFPSVINNPDWFVIDGPRLVVSWMERTPEMPEELAYHGVSSFLFDSDGKIAEYVGTFNMEDVARAFSG
jgi:hypothetical protein